MGVAVRRLQRALSVLLAAALEGLDLGEHDREMVAVLVDFPFWDSLDRAGIPRDVIPARILDLARSELKRRRSSR